jgi:hypothetical protein
MANDPELEFIVKMRDEASKKADRLLSKLKQFNHHYTTNISIHVTDKQAIAQLERVARLTNAAGKRIKIDAETKSAKLKINALEAKVQALVAKPHTIRFKVEASFSKAAIESAIKQALPSAIKTTATTSAASGGQVAAQAQPVQKLTYKYLHSQVMKDQYAAASLEAAKSKEALQGKYLAGLSREMATKKTLLALELDAVKTSYTQSVERLKMDKGRENSSKRILAYEELLKKVRADELALSSRLDLTEKQRLGYANALQSIRQKLLMTQLAEAKAAKANTDALYTQTKLAATLQGLKRGLVHMEAQESKTSVGSGVKAAQRELLLYQQILSQKEALLSRVVGSKKSIFATKEDVSVLENVGRKLKSLPAEIKTKVNMTSFLKLLSVVELLTKRILLLSSVVGAVGFVAMGAAVAYIAKKSVDLNSNFELFQTQLRTTLGSLAAAKQEMAEIVEFAKETPYQIEEVVKSVVKLRAYYMDSSVWLEPLGDMAAAFGLPIENAVEAAADAIRGEFRRIRQYGFIFRVDDFRKGGKYAGMTYADAVLKAVESRFKGGMELQAKTMKGIISNIKDTFTISLTEAGKPFYTQIKAMAQELLDWLNKAAKDGTFNELVGSLNAAALDSIKSIRSAIEYIMDNWGPALKNIFSSSMDILGQVINFVKEFTGGVGLELVRMFLDVASTIASVASWANILFKIWVGYKVIVGIFGKLAFETAALNGALAAQTTMFEGLVTKISFVGKRLLWLAAIFTVLDAFNNRADYSRNLDGLVDTLGSIEAPKSELDKYFKKLGAEISLSKMELAEAAGAVTKFGSEWEVVLETGARVADDLGMSVKDAAIMVGKLGEAGGMSAEEIKELAKSLLVAKQVAKSVGLEFEDTMGIILDYPEVLAGLSDGFDGMVAMIAQAEKAGVNVKEVFEALSMLLTPTEEMITKLDPSIFLTRSTAEAQNLASVFDAVGESGISNLTDVDKALEKLGNTSRARAKQILDGGKLIEEAMSSYMSGQGKSDAEIADMKTLGFTYEQVREAIISMRGEVEKLADTQQKLRDSSAYLTASLEQLQLQASYWNLEMQRIELEELDWNVRIRKLNESIGSLEDELSSLNAMEPTGFKDYTNATFALDQAINGINLEVAEQQLALLSGTILDQSKLVNRLKYDYEAADSALEPLRKQVQALRDDFDAATAAMEKAQSTLDGLTGAKFEGDEEYQRKMHDIDMEKKRLQLSLTKANDKVDNFGEWGQDTDAYKAAAAEVEVINARLTQLGDLEEQIRLERELSIGDVQFEIGLLADTRPEQNITEALNKAKEAREQYEAVRPTAERLADEVSAAEDTLATAESYVTAKQQAYEAAQSELTAMQSIHQEAIDTLSLEQQRLTTLRDILSTQWDINTAGFYKTKDELGNNVQEGNPDQILQRIRDINAEIETAKQQVGFWEGVIAGNQARKDELSAQLAENAVEQARVQIELDQVTGQLNDIENKIADYDALIKDLVSNIGAMIESIDGSAFLNADTTITQELFGEDLASDIQKMEQYRDVLAEIVSLQGSVTGAESGGGSGPVNWMKDHPIAAGGIAIAGVAGAALVGKKYGVKAAEKAGGMKIPGTGGKTVAEFQEYRAAEQAAERAGKIETLNKSNLQKIDELKLKNPDLGAKAEEAWTKRLAQIQETESIRALQKTDPELAKMLGYDKKNLPKIGGKDPGLMGKLFGWTGLGMFGSKDLVESVKNVGKGKGPWDKLTGNLYSFMKTGNNAAAAAEGLHNPAAVLNRAETLVSGNLQGKAVGGGKSWLQTMLGGGKNKAGIKVPGGGKGGLLGAGLAGLALGGIFGGDIGSAVEGGAHSMAYMGVEKAGQFGISKIAGAGLGKLVPVLGTIGLLGDLAGMLEGALGKDLGSVAGDAVGKAAGWVGFEDNGKGLGEATGQAVNGVVDTAQNISGVFNGLAGGLVGLGKGIFTGDWSYLKDSMSELWENLKMIPENILKAIGGALGSIMEIGEEIFGKITEPFSKAWGWLVENFAIAAWLDEKIIQPVLGFLSGAWAGIKDFLKDPWNNFKEFLFSEDGVQSWPGKIFGWLGDIVDWLDNTWSSVSGALSGPFSSAWDWISTNVSAWFTSIIDWLKGIPEWFGDTWNSITDKVTAPFKAAWDWISNTENGIASWPGKVWNWIKSIPAKIGELWNDLKGAGESIANAIGEGLSAAWAKIKDIPGVGEIIGLFEKAGGFISDTLASVGIGKKSHSGEILNGPATQEYFRIVRGQEAIIPLQNGKIPVQLIGGVDPSPEKLYTGGTKVESNVKVTNLTVSEGAFQITVRDNEDLEVVKKAILDLRRGQMKLSDSPFNYPEGY